MPSLLTLDIIWPLQLLLIFLVLATRAFLLAGGSSLLIRFSKWVNSRQIVQGKIDFKTYLSEIGQGMLVLMIDSTVAIFLVRTGVFHFVKVESFRQFFLTFTAMFIWVEIYFYYSHRVFHQPRFFWIHRHHHQSARLNPWTSLSFSVVERLILLAGVTLLPAVISIWLPFPAEAFVGYLFVNYALNVFGHLNTEILPGGFTKTWLGKVMNTTTYHSLHHQRYRGHFTLFTPFLDQLHGTRFADYEERQRENYAKGLPCSSWHLVGVRR